ncbi:glycosyltransferase involved in cell wall biosynthesis [Flavobacterium araucananum]|uniref:Teichuronic acid biosynthesis glycosyl transferase n=1 Tax=Flavobacterium araucananum TaxID=946678 RepID=A0A227PI82_9FLAO|nr:glycosyltransferase family 2 protein [Flavobacterium araucananum]OXG08765.1 teichuronic acid biosynthesis glycosyl transferase [Flavobacterium araucananum]PWJ97745.1 glycosyltransferase involved in cell wall biosynthesis [Flavobacterium araucananum]
MEKGLVSIITPMYNGERFVGDTINSVLNQTYSNWEIIVIDDGSKDNGPEKVKKFADQDNRISIFSQANGGSAAARNNGIRRAKGQYIALLDADDTWNSDFLEKQIKLMNDKNALLVYSSHTRIDEHSKEILTPFIVPEKINYNDLLKSCYISCLTGLYDTSVYGKIYLREDMKSLRDDYVYWLEIMKKVKIAYGNKEVIANYRILNSSASRKKNKVIIPHFKVLYKVEKLGLIKSLYYLGNWAFISYFKYRK